MIRTLLLALAFLVPALPALAGDGNDGIAQTTTVATQLGAIQAAVDALTACLTYDPAARDANGRVPLPRGKGIVCPTPTAVAQTAALGTAKSAALAANTTLGTDLTGLGLPAATANQGVIATQLAAIQGAVDAIDACVAYDPTARDGSGRVPLPRGKPVVCPPATVSTQVAALTTAKGAAATADAAILAALNGAGYPTGGGIILAADRDASANWAKAGLLSVGGIPTRSTQCGSTVNPIGGGSDDTAAIQAAINACTAGQVVLLGSGTFSIVAGSNNYILLNKGVTLRGAGAGTTILSKVGGATPGSINPGGNASAVVRVGSTKGGFGPSTGTLLTADAAKGSYSVAVTSAAGISAGMVVMVDELSGAQWMTDPEVTNDGIHTAPDGQVWAAPDWRVVYQMHNPSQGFDDFGSGTVLSNPGNITCAWANCDRPQSEMHQVTGVSGNTITFDSPIAIPYRTSHSAKLYYFNNSDITQNAGIENLTLENGDGGNLVFYGCAYCWAKNIESRHWIDVGISFIASFRSQLTGSYSHEAYWPIPGGGGYAIGSSWWSSENLIDNNISILANKIIEMRESGTGSVVAYNYFDKGMTWLDLGWQEMGANASHMVGPHHVLFEGNHTFNMDSDHTHGNSTYMTYFRNRSTGYRSAFNMNYLSDACGDSDDIGNTAHNYNHGTNTCDLRTGNGPLRAAGPDAWSYWFSFIGNVLGTSGHTSGWVYERQDWNSSAIFMMGWDDLNSTFGAAHDPTVQATVFRHGNYEYVNNAQTFDSGTANHTLPNSMYLSGAPSFFAGSCATWPWVTPEGATKVYTLPAKARFDAGTPNTPGSGC